MKNLMCMGKGALHCRQEVPVNHKTNAANMVDNKLSSMRTSFFLIDPHAGDQTRWGPEVQGGH